MAAKYLVPSLLYAVYNILTYYNLETYDPTTYFVLLQIRVVVTGVVWQFLFKERLTRRQWGALVLLMSGCVLKQYDFTRETPLEVTLDPGLVLVMVQVGCSCLAGVFTEYLLKGNQGAVHYLVQVCAARTKT